MAELDLSALWSWIIPLWSIFLIVAFLGGVLITPIALQHVRTPAAKTAHAVAVPV
jgi:hypothetical protein